MSNNEAHLHHPQASSLPASLKEETSFVSTLLSSSAHTDTHSNPDTDGSSGCLPPQPHSCSSRVGFALLPLELQQEIAAYLRWPDASFCVDSTNPTPSILHRHPHYQQHQPPSSERQLLKLRLVSRSLGSRVALSPSFWHEIHFNKRIYNKPSSSRVPSSSAEIANVSTATAHHPSLYSYVHPSPFQIVSPPPRPSHDMDLDVNPMHMHPQSLASALLQPPARQSRANHQHPTELIDPAAGASLSVSNPEFNTFHQGIADASAQPLPPLPASSQASITTTTTPAVRWQEKVDSFLQFMKHLASLTDTAEAVHRVVIEDIADKDIVQELWSVLVRMPKLKEISLKRMDGCESLIKQLVLPSSAQATDGGINGFETAPPRWYHLTRLDLTGSVQLRDIWGLRDTMPALTTVILEGCKGIMDFRPLVRVGYKVVRSSDGQEDIEYESGVPQPSSLQTLILSQTEIKDEQLIEVVHYSPNLLELRLEQCYGLTERALQAIGQGLKTTISPLNHEVFGPRPILDLSGSRNSHNNPAIPTAISTSSPHSPCPNLRVLSVKGCWDMEDYGVRALAGCPSLEMLIIRGLRHVSEETVDWLHEQGVPLRSVLSPLGHWRYFLPR
ncbi:hypothetical protein BGW41_008274 [Actinomortierella wolfii]|nr:hypothetical protein BGW41_008274 [Actinomortierella wolfii]